MVGLYATSVTDPGTSEFEHSKNEEEITHRSAARREYRSQDPRDRSARSCTPGTRRCRIISSSSSGRLVDLEGKLGLTSN